MLWATAIPNLLIGLREGLEAGLVVSILLAAVHRTAPQGMRRPSFPIWIGVIGAVSVAGSFAAVLTVSTSVLSSAAQEAVGGSLSVLAVVLVSWMVFWMRRTARGLSGELTEQVRRVTAIGAGSLAVAAFLAVGREGLETTLFLWTAARASGSTVAPLVGAGIGIAIAIALCSLLFRGAVRMNLGVFFSRTGLALIVLAAGILAYGLGDLQDAGLLPGQNWIAFDISGTVASDSWWMSIITGATELSTKMTVLQVVAWVVYLGVMIPLFVRKPKPAAAPAAAAPAAPATAAPAPAAAALADAAPAASPAPEPAQAPEEPVVPLLTRWLHAAERRTWLVVGTLIVVPALLAGVIIALLPAQPASAATPLTVTKTACGTGWSTGRTGSQTFEVTNDSGAAAEVNLDNASGEVVAEIETLGPATTAAMSATLSAGTYTIECYLSGQHPTASAPVTVSGGSVASAPVAVVPETVKGLTPANDRYQQYAAAELSDLATRVAQIQSDLSAGDLGQAKADWLQAQLDWEQVGASYDSFGDLGEAVDGLPEAYQGGVNSPDFTGLHRLEYGLWHGQPIAELQSVTATLAAKVHAVQKNLGSDDLAGDPTNLPLRAHEILEDALRDHLSGQDDQGSGAGYAETYADTQITGAILGFLAPQIQSRAPKVLPAARQQLAALQAALQKADAGGSWQSPQQVSLTVRQHIDAALGAYLETASAVPDLLEVPPHP